MVENRPTMQSCMGYFDSQNEESTLMTLITVDDYDYDDDYDNLLSRVQGAFCCYQK